MRSRFEPCSVERRRRKEKNEKTGVKTLRGNRKTRKKGTEGDKENR